MARRSGVLFPVAMFALLFSFVPTAVAQHVNTAPTFFAASGSVVAGLPDVYETGNAVAVQPDGKILVGGNSATIIDPANWTYGENLLLLARFNVDGSLDTSFGSDGYATVNVWTSDYIYEAVIGISVLSNGKIVVGVGDAYVQHEGQPGFGAARLNADGTVDTSFGVNGVRLVSSTSGQDTAHRMILDASGNILIVGESPNSPSKIFVARITPDGNLDTSFGTAGIVTTLVGDGNSLGNGIAVQSDGKIVVTGTSWSASTTLVTVLRYTSTGAIDTTFGGSDGIATFDVAPGYNTGMAVAIQSDGKIVVGGQGVSGTLPSGGSNMDLVVLRLNSDGTLDTTFNTTGTRLVDLGNYEQLSTLSVQSDGKILLGGQSAFKAAFVRLASDGSLDQTFNGTGIVTTTYDGNGIATALQNDGRIVSVGSVNDSTGTYSDLTVLRLNSDGTTDISFGLNPVNTLDNAPTYVQGTLPVLLDANVSIYDAELSGGSYAGATLTLVRQGGPNAGDTFRGSGTLGALTQGANLTVNGTVIGTVTTNSGGTLLLTFSSNSTQTLVNSALRQIAYSNNSTASPASVQINWTFSDGNTGSQGAGGALSASGSTTVNVLAAAPTAVTGAASSITGPGATLNGNVSDNGANTTVSFEYGQTTIYGSSVAASPSLVSAGSGSTSVSATISGLSCSTTYHFRVTATNSVATTNGGDATFTTGACAPGAPTGVSATAGDTQATVSFTAPVSNGGAAITSYTATSSPGGITGTSASSPIVVTGLTNGNAYTFTVTATNSAGTGTPSAASNSVTPKASQTITFNNPGTQNFGTTPTLTATVSSGLAVTFSSSTTSVCTITSGGALTFASTGPCTINAEQAGNSAYLAAPTVTQSFAVAAVPPGVPTGASAIADNGQATIFFTAPSFTGGASITGYTATSNPGGITGSAASGPITVTGLTNGTAYTFTVTATNSAGTSTSSAASNSVTPKASQTITFNNPGTQNFGTSATLTATATSGLTVTFWSSTTSVCTITSAGVLHFGSTGLCTITADQLGNGAFLAAPMVTQSFMIAAVVPGAPMIGIGAATAGNGQATVSFSAPVSNGGAAITSYTATSNPGGITGTSASSPIIVTGLTNGNAYTFTVTATNSAGTGPASVASNSVTPKANQIITFNNPGMHNFGTAPTLTATASSGLAVTFSSSTTSVCTITSGGSLTTVSTGPCTINADQAGSNAFLAAPQVSQSFVIAAVVPGAPTIGTATAGNAQATVNFTAPASNGGAAITGYTATSSPGGFTGTGASSPITITGLANGTAYTFTVTATNSAGTSTPSAASNSVTPKASQTITFNNPATQNFGTSPTLTATASSGLTVTFWSSTTSVCMITSGGALNLVSTGLCTIDADQAGSAAYSPAPTVTRTFSVNAVVPGAPTEVTAIAGDRQVSVSFAAPSFAGGANITGYTAVSTPGGFTGTSASSPITVTGLTNGTAYTFTVTATNSAGTGSASAASSSVTPVPDVETPVATAASNVVFTGFTANWNSIPGATSYHLDLATDKAFTAMVSGYSDLDVGNAASKAVTGLSSATPYFYRVRAYSSTSTSFDSNIIAVTTATARTVTNTNDSGSGTLRQVIADANPGDVISFAEELNGQTIMPASPLVISRDLTISGPDTANLTISGNQAVQIFQVTGAIRLTLQHLSLINGNVNGAGGALADNSNATIVITGCTFSNNAASDDGGALALHGTITITDSLFTGNIAQYHGGAIYQGGAALTVTNVTLSGNTSVDGGAIYNLAGTTSMINATIANNSSAAQGGGITIAAGVVTLKNSIVANNSAAASGPDVYGLVTSQGHNLVRNVAGATFVTTVGDLTAADPVLGPLADNGGRTQTMTLLSGSPAINAGTCTGAPATDQRGMSRPQDGSCDMGAYERGAPAELTDISGTPQSTLVGTEFTAPLHLKVVDSMGVGLDGANVSFAGPDTGAGIAANGTVVADAKGAVEYAVSANATPGTYRVTATVGTLSTNYSLTNDAPLAQTISGIIFNPPNLTLGGEIIASATATSGLPVSFTSLTPTICGVSGVIVSGLHVGTCTVRAEQPGSVSYLPAPPVDQDLQVTYSTNPPVLTISALSEGATTANSTQNISGVASDPGGIQSLTINHKPVQVYEDGSFTYPVQLLAGSNSITIVATNHADISTTDTRSITLNSTAPMLWINDPPDNASLSHQHITCNGTIPSGNTDSISSVHYSVNGSSPQVAPLSGRDYSFPADLGEGINTIRVFATTESGMNVEAKRTVFYAPGFSLGITNPVEDIRTPLGSYTITGSVGENATPVEVTITVDDLTFTPAVVNGIFQQQISFSNDKVYQIAVTGVDENGNRVVARRNIIRGGSSSNGTGFTMADAVEAMQISLGLISPPQSEVLRLDVAPLVNGVSMSDGKIDIEDVAVILRMAVGVGQ